MILVKVVYYSTYNQYQRTKWSIIMLAITFGCDNHRESISANIYLFKVNNKNTRKRSEIYSELTKKKNQVLNENQEQNKEWKNKKKRKQKIENRIYTKKGRKVLKWKIQNKKN